MTSKIKVDNITNQSDSNIVNKCGTTITLGASGDTISLASGASQTGFGRTGTVDWDTTPKTATFSAVSGNGYFCNTSGGAFTVNLPAGVAGAIVSLADYAATWQTYNVTVAPNGTDKIGSVNANATLNVEGQSVTFVYVDSTQGWINTMDSTSNVRAASFIIATGGTITTCGNDKIHTFTGPGTFTVCSTSSTAVDNNISYLVIAGGGGTQPIGGGGGGGGFRELKGPSQTYTVSPLNGSTPITITASSYPITVGAGGAGAPCNTVGSNSIFSTITSAGGGTTGGRDGGASPPAGNGGSGGGAGHRGTSGGTGNTPPVSPSQGFPGGAGGACHYAGDGGGGATEAGQAGGGSTTSSTGGRGGTGANTQISGGPVAYSGGGGGGAYTSTQGAGSPCGTGAAGGARFASGGNGTVNRGGGGGGIGESGSGGGLGGSGIVIIRYKFQ